MPFPVRLGTCVILCSLPLAAQLLNNSITVTAYPASTVSPDEVVFSVVVTAGIDQTLDTIVNAVSGLGLTAANLVNLGGSLPCLPVGLCSPGPITALPPPQQWTFQLVVPFSKLKATTAALASLQKTIGQANSGLSLTWSVTGTQLSSQSANCSLANLVAQARAQVQQIATAASITPGAIVSLTSSNTACLLTAGFSLGIPSATSSLTITTTDPLPTAPDQAIITIYVTSGGSANLSDISNGLAAVGITGVTFGGIYDEIASTPPTSVVWTFTETIPLTQLIDNLAQLAAAGQTIAQGSSGLSLTFGTSGLSFSQPPACSQAELLSEAKIQAQNVAAAAGVNAGPVLSLSTQGYGTAPALLAVSGQLGAAVSSSGIYDPYYSVPSVPVQTPTCSLTAQFQLL